MACGLAAWRSKSRMFSMTGMPLSNMSMAHAGREAKSSRLRGVKRNGTEKWLWKSRSRLPPTAKSTVITRASYSATLARSTMRQKNSRLVTT